MSIYLSNSLYLYAGFGADINENNPIIGYQSVLTDVDIIATEYVTGRSALNMWNPSTSSLWEGQTVTATPTATTTQYVTLINSANLPVDYLAIARHNLGTVGYTYTVQHSTDAGATWADITTARVIATDQAIFDYFDEKTSDQFRIKLEKTLTGAPAVIDGPVIAHVKLGKAFVLQRRIYAGHKPGTITKKVKKIVNGSESGEYLGAIVTRSYYTTDCQQDNNSPEFVRTYVKPFIAHVNGHTAVDGSAPCTFFFSWRPSDYPDEIVYGWTSDNIEVENKSGDSMGGRMKWGFSMECIA
jgi:hypothetical protein